MLKFPEATASVCQNPSSVAGIWHLGFRMLTTLHSQRKPFGANSGKHRMLSALLVCRTMSWASESPLCVRRRETLLLQIPARRTSWSGSADRKKCNSCAIADACGERSHRGETVIKFAAGHYLSLTNKLPRGHFSLEAPAKIFLVILRGSTRDREQSINNM